MGIITKYDEDFSHLPKNMAKKVTEQPHQKIEKTLKQILDAGCLTYQQHFQLTSLCLSDLKVTDSQRKEINRVFDLLQTGELKLVAQQDN